MSAKLKVLAKRNGFRRAGIEFSDTEAKIIEIGSLSKEQIEAIKADPNLVVVEGESFDAEKGKSGKEDAADLKKALADLKGVQGELTKTQADLKKAQEDLETANAELKKLKK